MSEAFALSEAPVETDPGAELVGSCRQLVGMLVELRDAAIRTDAAGLVEITERMDRQLAAIEKLGMGLGRREQAALRPRLEPVEQRLRFEALADGEILSDLLACLELRSRCAAGPGHGIYDPRGKLRARDFPGLALSEEA